MPSAKYLLFDCDNTLVLSEDIAFRGCALLSNEILAKHGVNASYTGTSLRSRFVGMNFQGVLGALQEVHNFEMSDEEISHYVKSELDTVTRLLSEEATSCPGADDVLARLYRDGKYGMAVVSSSALPRVKASIRKTGQDKFFNPDHIYSAASSLKVPTSKPDPAVYLFACEQLGVKASECVAIEDSKSGALAAHRAGIPCIGYVGPYEDPEERDAMVRVLKEEAHVLAIMHHWQEFDGCLSEVEGRTF